MILRSWCTLDVTQDFLPADAALRKCRTFMLFTSLNNSHLFISLTIESPTATAPFWFLWTLLLFFIENWKLFCLETFYHWLYFSFWDIFNGFSGRIISLVELSIDSFSNRRLLVRSQQKKHQNNVWNLFKSNNKDIRTTSVTLLIYYK